MLSFKNSITFTDSETDLASLVNCWEPEDEFVWSTGKWCEIRFAFQISTGHATIKSADLIVDLDAFKGQEEGAGQNAYFYLNGLRIGTVFINARAIQMFSFDPKLLRGSENVITIDTPESSSPKDHGEEDARVLGVQIYSLQIRRN